MSLEETYRRYRHSERRQRAWAADNPGNVAIREELLRHLFDLTSGPLAGVGHVLDVGCGGGWLLEQLTEHGVATNRLHGVDLLEPRVGAARRRLPGADIQRADARRLPHPNGAFAVVTMLTCLSSMPDREAVRDALAEGQRVLAPGGMLICYEPWLPNPLNRATLWVSPRLLRRSLGPPTHARRLTAFPPLARRLGRLTPRLYPLLSRVVPSHRFNGWSHDA